MRSPSIQEFVKGPFNLVLRIIGPLLKNASEPISPPGDGCHIVARKLAPILLGIAAEVFSATSELNAVRGLDSFKSDTCIFRYDGSSRRIPVDQMRPRSRSIIRISTIKPIPPLGAKPQLRL